MPECSIGGHGISGKGSKFLLSERCEKHGLKVATVILAADAATNGKVGEIELKRLCTLTATSTEHARCADMNGCSL